MIPTGLHFDPKTAARLFRLAYACALAAACVLTGPGLGAGFAGPPPDALFSGKAFPSERVEIRTFGTGKIREVNVGIGQYVKENATLLSYDGDAERLAEIKKKLSTAKISSLEWEKQKLLRDRNMEFRDATLYGQFAKNNMATQNQIDSVNTRIYSTEMRLDAVNEELTNAKDELRAEQQIAWYTIGIKNAKSKDVKRQLRIHSPIPGHVLWINPDFHAGAELKHDVKAFIIGDMSKVRLTCDAYEAALRNLKEGEKVQVRFDAIPDKAYNGVIAKTQWAAANVGDKSKPSMFEVDVSIDNPKLEIKEGLVGHVYPQK